MKQTSDRMSKLAAKMIKLFGDDIEKAVYQGKATKLSADIRSLAASVLSQDEVKGNAVQEQGAECVHPHEGQ